VVTALKLRKALFQQDEMCLTPGKARQESNKAFIIQISSLRHTDKTLSAAPCFFPSRPSATSWKNDFFSPVDSCSYKL